MVQQFKPSAAQKNFSTACSFKNAARRAAVVAGIGLGFITGCTEPVRYEPTPIGALPAGSLARDWLADLKLKNDAVNTIDVRDQSLYVITENKQVTCISRKAGAIKFVAKVSSPADRLLPPVELKDTIVFPTAISLELFNYKGEHVRTVPLSVPLRSGAAGSGDMIYFGADDPAGGRVQAIDLSRSFNHGKWQLLTPGGGITSAPVLYSGILYIGTEAGEIYAVNESRNAVWATPGGIFQTAGPIVSDLRVDNDGLYVACKDSKLYCINRITGKLLWQYFAGSPLGSAPVPTSDTVYQFVPGQGLAAITKDPKAPYNRTPRWVFPEARQFLSQDEKYAYVMVPRVDPDDNTKITRTIVAVDKQTGERAFESKHTDFAVFGTNTRDSIIYAGYANGQIIAIRPVVKAGEIGELVLAPAPIESVAMSN